MARRVSWGTPSKSLHYIFPRGKWGFLRPALLGSGAVLALILLLHAVGYRTPVTPGPVIGDHANFESNCQECHQTRHGASNLRCQRCHDPAGAGRLTNNAHVFFGSTDPKKAAAAPSLDCAQCHIDHRGRAFDLAAVDQAQCFSCHFRGLSGHPEFKVLREKREEIPGVLFTHDRHVKEEVKKRGGLEKDTCVRCHEPQPATARSDLEPIVFARHCASCHEKDGSVGTVDPIPETDVLGPSQLEALGLEGFDPESFSVSRGKVSRASLSHQDEWVLLNLRRLRREIDPEGYAAERGALQARVSQLERRLAQTTPLAGLDLEALRARQTAVESEIKGLEARIEAQTNARTVADSLARVDEVAAAAAAVGDADAVRAAAELKTRGDALKAAGLIAAALPAADVDARRKEMLAALEAVESVDPALKLRTDDLRRRLLAVSPGDTGAEILKRALDQRRGTLERLGDETALRGSGVAPPSSALLAGEQRAIRDALTEAQARLQDLSEGPPPAASLTDEDRERKKESVQVLTAACTKCHVVEKAAFKRVVPAQRVLVRSTFVHGPHLLQADCARCHAGVELSKKSSDLNFKGVATCQECHRPRQVRDDCDSCHKYHPPVAP